MRAWLSSKLIYIICFCLVTSGCGFHLRGFVPIAFKSVRVTGNTQLTEPLKQLIRQQGAEVVTGMQQPAELELELMREESEKNIASLSGQGVVREFGLIYRVRYRSRIAGDAVWGDPLIMESRRSYTFNDANLLAKQAEEKRLSEDMRLEVMQGIMRRITALKRGAVGNTE